MTAAAVTQAFCTRTGYPRELVDPSIRLDPEALLQRFRERIVGQDEATLLLRNLIATLKTGLADSSRPLGAFLLLGPTGVGKTESALALAEYLFGDTSRLARFDMAEYAAPGSAARLVGEVGGQQGGLARRVREQPFGVVLLDDVEKADFDARYGARPLKRAVEQQVVAPLAQWLTAQAGVALRQVLLRVGENGQMELARMESTIP